MLCFYFHFWQFLFQICHFNGIILVVFCSRSIVEDLFILFTGNLSTCLFSSYQSRTQSPQAFWSAGGCLERLWGIGILFPQDFCSKTVNAVTGQPIKKIK